MRLKIAVSFVESTYGIIGFLALVSFIGSFFFLKGTILVITLVASLGVLVAIFFLKTKLINYYLKRCKYPHEFLSVLDQLELLEDLQINWSNDGVRNSNHLTNQFLEDNSLVTEIGKRKLSFPFIIFMCFGSAIGLAYFGNMDPFPGKAALIAILITCLAFGLYLAARGRKRSNDNEPILIFNEKALLFENENMEWNRIDSWRVKDGWGDSERYIIISYKDANNSGQELKIPLHNLNIDRIDCLLLLTHFKTKYGNDSPNQTIS